LHLGRSTLEGLGFAINLLSVDFEWEGAGRDEVDVMEVISSLTAQQLQLPVILRFPDMLQHRMRELQDCFSSAIAKFGYEVCPFLH